jgi:hypothetical protein
LGANRDRVKSTNRKHNFTLSKISPKVKRIIEYF